MRQRRLLPMLGGIDSFVAIIALGILFTLPCSAQNPPTSNAEDSRLQELYRGGRNARERGDLQTALRLLEQAWTIRQTHDGAASLAQVEYELGKTRDAAEHLAFAIDHLPADVEPGRANGVRDAFERIRKEVVTLRVRVEPKTAEIFMNGKSLGLASDLSKEIYADPGKVQISASCDGYISWSTVLSINAGETQDVSTNLKPVAQQGDAAHSRQNTSELNSSTPYHIASPSAHKQTGENRPWWPIAVPAGATIASLTVGLIFTVEAGSSKSDGDQAREQIGNSSGCVMPTSSQAGLCARLSSARHDEGSANRVANTAFIAAGTFASVTAATMAWYFFWPRTEHATRAQVTPVFAPNSAALSIQGSF